MALVKVTDLGLLTWLNANKIRDAGDIANMFHAVYNDTWYHKSMDNDDWFYDDAQPHPLTQPKPYIPTPFTKRTKAEIYCGVNPDMRTMQYMTPEQQKAEEKRINKCLADYNKQPQQLVTGIDNKYLFIAGAFALFLILKK